MTERKLTSELLSNVRRHKTHGRKSDRAALRPPAEATVEESFNTLTAQSDRLERNLQMFRLQNKKILDDNRCLFANVLRSKRENSCKIRDVFACAFTMLHSLEGGRDLWAEPEAHASTESLDSGGESSRNYAQVRNSMQESTQSTAGFRRRVGGGTTGLHGSVHRGDGGKKQPE